MGKEKVSLITTVLNEENSIEQFLASIYLLSLKPDEVIIVDAGSTDRTKEKILRCKDIKIKGINLVFLSEKGANRSVGRNIAIQKAKNEIIAMSDAGCVLDEDWLIEIVKPFSDKKTDVVAGYYKALAKNVFEKCVAPYALVMPDKVNPNEFLPSSRSMAIRKSVWKKYGGFPEDFNESEDYLFSLKLKKGGAKIVFAQDAVVGWRPRPNLKSFWIMIYKFARSDGRAGLRRLKVASYFLRYALFILLCFISMIFHSLFETAILLAGFYLGWSVWKNYRYVKDPRAIIILPVLQVVSDLAVIAGSIKGGLESE